MNMIRVDPKVAAEELGMDPIGVAIKKEGKKRWSYYIYRNLLDQYKENGGISHAQ